MKYSKGRFLRMILIFGSQYFNGLKLFGHNMKFPSSFFCIQNANFAPTLQRKSNKFETTKRAMRPRCVIYLRVFIGARILCQDPVECLFQFICSSNNHISRIHGMVERLCRNYGTPLKQTENLDTVEQSLSELQKDSVSTLVIM